MKAFQKFLFAGLATWFCACSGENGANGKDAYVDVDSLATVLRDEIKNQLWDSLYSQPYIDTVYNILFDNAFAESWMDSVRSALCDSLYQADYDSLYQNLYDSVYYDIYSQAAIKDLDAWVWNSKDDIYTAFANQYPLMYEDFKDSASGEEIPQPLSVKVRNSCNIFSLSGSNLLGCSHKKVVVKAWVEGFSDTGSVTTFVNSDTTKLFAPQLHFKPESYLDLKAPAQAQYQIRAYALENDHEILFFSETKPVTVHPVQVYGTELVGVQNMNWWHAAWVTPNMDSIQNILNDLKGKLPDSTVKTYQLYSADTSIAQSSRRVVQAVFEVLQARTIHYVQNPDAGSPGQKIKYPIETLRNRDGLCIETTVLVASVLEAIGLQTFLVMVPGHSFVGWRTEKGSSTLDFVETTLLGSESSFSYANSAAIKRYNEEVTDGTFASGESELIDLEKVRRYGIMPNDIP